MPSWSAEDDNILREMWAQGFSGSQIARKLGNRSRCAVLGRLDRLGAARKRPHLSIKPNMKAVVARKPVRPTVRSTVRLQPDHAHLRIVEEVEIPEAERMHLLVRNAAGRLCANEKFTASCCRWPIGDPQTPEFHFCGRGAVVGLPYCEPHAKRAYPSVEISKPGEAVPVSAETETEPVPA